ncbi:unnamed protein product [Fraxinus pennsylvanica]|uniref:Uncharacterized protein n=1 Tax=Fraxinus pennsylvanica TaxID=56036 RepID=A0AAD1ZTT8_9LAMI|nr:unnamed protein product [Fraxinus pennsylvanica]
MILHYLEILSHLLHHHNPPLSVASGPSLLRRPLPISIAWPQRSRPGAPAFSIRGFATRPTSSLLNDPNPNGSNRPSKETILLYECDFEHWLVVVEKPEGNQPEMKSLTATSKP